MKTIATLTVLTLFTSALSATSVPSPGLLSPRSPNSPSELIGSTRMIRSLTKRCKKPSGSGKPYKPSDDDESDPDSQSKPPKTSKSHKPTGDNDPSGGSKPPKSSGSGGSGEGLTVSCTFYGGSGDGPGQLANPACFDGWNPNASEVYGIAVAQDWKNSAEKPKCGDYVQLTKGSKSVIARVIDECSSGDSGCKDFDLTPKVFSSLASLDLGILTGIKAEVVGKPSDYSEAKFGPAKTSG